MASQLPEDAWAGEWRKFVSHAGNPCGSPSPVLRRRVQNSITRSRQNQPPRAPKWALGGLRRNRRWEALRPPLRGGKRVSGRTFWELLLQRTLEACETMKHGSKINMFGALEIASESTPVLFKSITEQEFNPGSDTPLDRWPGEFVALLWSPVAKQRASARPRLLPGSTYGATEPPCTLPHIFLGKWLLPAPQSENQQHPPQVAPLQPSRRNPSPQQALQAYRTSPHHLKIINAATCGGL